MKLVNPFKIGADPEFIMLNADGSIYNSGLPYEGEVGSDHGGRVVELRPAPSRLAYRVVKRLNRMFHNEPLTRYSTPKWRAGGHVQVRSNGEDRSRVQSLGGHVHIDVPCSGYSGYSKESVEYLKTTDPAAYARYVKERELAGALDETIRNLEGLDILHAAEAQTRRRSPHGYGRFGEVRGSGRDNHLEYRTPISWLYSPVTSFVTLTSCKLAAAAPDSVSEFTSFSAYSDWLKRFVSADDDAARLCEKFTSLGAMQADPDADMKTTWPRELAF